MGSFNETCGVSGLPIGWRTPCRLFVLRPHWFLDLHYQSEWESLVVVPLRGVYADYGRLEDLDLSPAFRLQHRRLLATVQKFSEEAQKRHPEILRRYPDDPNALYELCERGVLEVKTPHGNRTTAPFYVREDVYQLVLERARKAEGWHGSFLEGCREAITARFKKVELERETLSLYKEDATEEDKVRRRELMDQKGQLDHLDHGPGCHEGRMILIESWDEIMSDPGLRASLEEAMLEFELFAGGMDAVKVAWQPKTIRGQDDDYESHAEWHRDVAKLADEAHRRQEEGL